MSLYEQLLQAYTNFQPANTATGQLATLKEQAFEKFKAKGIPTTKDEEWKFTSLKPFLNEQFSFIPAAADLADLSDAVVAAQIPGLDSWQLVLVNGVISAELSVLPENEQLEVKALREVVHTDAFLQHLAGAAEGNAMLALNTAFFQDGFAIEVFKNAMPDKPLQIIHLYTSAEAVFLQPRHFIRLHDQASLEITEAAVCLDGGQPVFVNSVTYAELGQQARLTHYHIQNNSRAERLVNYSQITQARDSRYDNFTFSLPGAELIRNNLEVVLNGTATETHLMGLYLVGSSQLTDNHTAIHHKFPNCESNEIYKGVLTGNGKAVFNGKVFVERPAQKTNAFQQNNNLLLSGKAQVFAKPQLEIFADDVKCSHGCTVGQFDPESVFYLQARGISEASARRLLVEAFMFDVTQKISNEAVKDYVQSLIYHKMENAFSNGDLEK